MIKMIICQTLYNIVEIICKDCTRRDIQPIIFYHPTVKVDKDGVPYTDTVEADLQAFKDACDKYDVIFIDMTDTFIDNYNKSYILPHGFFNTSAGKGHLNENGHRMIAEKLYDVITSREAEQYGF